GAAQSGLWGKSSRNEEHATRAANRVQSLLGAEGVLTAVPQGGRTPRERIRYVAWGDEQVAERDPAAPWPGQLPTPLPTTVFPEPIRVELLAEGTPVRMTPRGGLTRGPEELNYDRRLYPVDGWAGPWPVYDRWWEGEAPQVYLQVVSPAGAWLVAGGQEGWGIEGVYDYLHAKSARGDMARHRARGAGRPRRPLERSGPGRRCAPDAVRPGAGALGGAAHRHSEVAEEIPAAGRGQEKLR